MMIFIKYLLFIIFTYLIILLSGFPFLFNPIKKNFIEKNNILNNLYINNFETKIYMPLLDNQYSKIKEYSDELIATKIIDDLSIEYTSYYITVNNILTNSNNIKTKDWILDDIAVDSKFGKLERINDTIYQLSPDEDYKFTYPLEIKFQALNDSDMQNSISSIDFRLPQIEIEKLPEENNIFIQKLKEFIHLENIKIEKRFLIDDANQFALIKYTINNNIVLNQLYSSLVSILEYYSIIFLATILLIMLFNIYMLKINIINYLKKLEIFSHDILHNNFYKFDSKLLKQKEMVNIAGNIGSISKKMASIINELNVNKDTIELQISTDVLTKLPNTKIFEQDMKALFLTDIKSYIIKIKLESLTIFSKENSQVKTDELIVDFADLLKESIKTYNGKIYRVYGSEFLLIVKYCDFDIISSFFSIIETNIDTIKNKYTLDTKLYHSVSLPIDHYSTTDNITRQLDSFYNQTVSDMDKNYFIQDSKKVNEEDEKLEKIIKSIITNDAFSLSYKFNTYLFSDPDLLVMQEVSPNLINTDGSVIQIGTFIAVAEHLNLAIDFDKQLIIKTFKYIKQHEISHDLVINLSISSLSDKAFLNWLEAQILYDYKNILDKVVFSVTAFAVKNNYEMFANFTNNIKKFNGRILLKRFSYNDLTLEQLENLNLDFIRVHKDYTTNIDNDREVVLKNIINFGHIHDIFILGDMVSQNDDYESLQKLKFYATSK